MLINKAKLLNKIVDGVFNQIVDNYGDYVDEFGITIDEENVFDHQFEKAIEGMELPKWQQTQLSQEFWESDELDKAFGAAKEAVMEILEDKKEWDKGPMHYYGLRESDFR
jgi:hypothetical protein